MLDASKVHKGIRYAEDARYIEGSSKISLCSRCLTHGGCKQRLAVQLKPKNKECKQRFYYYAVDAQCMEGASRDSGAVEA